MNIDKMISLYQYKSYFIEEGPLSCRLFDKDNVLIREFPNALAAKMWVELNE